MNKFIILDDVFDDNTVEKIKNFDYNYKWHWMGDNPIQEKMIDVARMFFDLSASIGYELWSNDFDQYRTEVKGSELDWHFDHNMKKFARTGIYEFPLCTVVYYPLIKNLRGGEFLTENAKFIPKTNRMVLFSPGVQHAVTEYLGLRFAISINIWDSKVEE